MSSFRRFGRTPTIETVTLAHHSVGEVNALTQDVSETGLFVCGEQLLGKVAVGDVLSAKLENIYHDMKVVRLTEQGVGLVYL